MNSLKAFMAGIVVPTIALPLALGIAWKFGMPEFFEVGFLHFLPFIWGLWNVLYFLLFKRLCTGTRWRRLWFTGGLLGLLVAIYGVFWLHLPEALGLPESLIYLPLIVLPVVYGLLWRFFVRPLNDLLNLSDE